MKILFTLILLFNTSLSFAQFVDEEIKLPSLISITINGKTVVKPNPYTKFMYFNQDKHTAVGFVTGNKKDGVYLHMLKGDGYRRTRLTSGEEVVIMNTYEAANPSINCTFVMTINAIPGYLTMTCTGSDRSYRWDFGK